MLPCMLIHEHAADIIISDRYNVYSLHKRHNIPPVPKVSLYTVEYVNIIIAH